MSKKEQAKKEKIRFILSAISGGAILLGVIILTVVVAKHSTSELFSTFDPISGLNYNKYIGYDGPDETFYLGFDHILDDYYNPDLAKQITDKVIYYFKQTKPDAEKVSYHKNSIKQKGEQQYFYVSADNEKYEIRVKPAEQSDYELEIHNYNDLVFSYKSAEHHYATHQPLTLLANHLPVSLIDGEHAFGVRSTDSKTLKIIVNSCGDQTIKDSAINYTKQWLKSIDYSPEDFEYIADDYCEE